MTTPGGRSRLMLDVDVEFPIPFLKFIAELCLVIVVYSLRLGLVSSLLSAKLAPGTQFEKKVGRIATNSFVFIR